jgi:hypothetical protein
MNVKSKDATKPARKAGGHGKPVAHGDSPPGRRRPVNEAGGPVDYDAPRKSEDGTNVDSLAELGARAAVENWAAVDEEDAVATDELEPPGADLSGEMLTIEVVPRQADEFLCTHCFLVHHRSQLTSDPAGRPVCTECAAA